MLKPKCISILSYKSSGSSACQYLLSSLPEINHISETRHYFNETLFWTKAASVLNKPLQRMIDTEVPFDQEIARKDLITLLEKNVQLFDSNSVSTDEELVFDGWVRLVKKHSPVFLEKSPHHLFQWSAIDLMLQGINNLPEIDFMFIGLVRNPMDVLYSAWKRWGTPLETAQYEWLTAYQNLSILRDIVADKLIMVRYEDMITDLNCLRPIFDFADIKEYHIDEKYLHNNSLSKWRLDNAFDFELAEEVVKLATQFGYKSEELVKLK
jgi:hypothetical protein